MSDVTYAKRDACADYKSSNHTVGPCINCGWSLAAHLTRHGIQVEPETPDESPRKGLPLWWEGQVAIDIARTAPKIKEYGTRDLEAMGLALMAAKGIESDSSVSHAPAPDVAAVYGCMLYALGKCMRAIASLERGEMPSEDTLFDLSVYSMMARAYQARGTLE